MKRINIIWTIVAIVAIVSTSCSDYKAKSVSLKSELDTLNYAFGYVNGKILKQYHLNNDSTGKQLKSFMEGVEAGLKEKEVAPEVRNVTEMGTMIGSQLKSNPDFYNDSTLKMDFNLLRQGLINGISGDTLVMNNDAARDYFNNTMQKMQTEKLEKQYKSNKEAGIKFLEENAKKDGVITTTSGLQYEIIKQGKGTLPTVTDKVKVHYHGTLIDGTVFDSSVDRGQPAEFGVTQVIKGWTEGLQLMPVGSKFKFYIPQELAYGSNDQGTIKPFSTLIFEVELLEIVK
ncbi:FKBP-type peptidyl-prolyl cis-trans isomerase N-terminal domain-containing protein [Paludibacter sp.]